MAEVDAYGRGSEAGWDIVYRLCPVDTQLMSAPASPGRTWTVLITERRVPVLASAAAAGIFRTGRWLAGLSGLGGVPTPACHADVGDQDHSVGKPGAERRAYRRLGCDLDSVSLEGGFHAAGEDQ